MRERELREKVTALTAENARLVRELQASKDSVELVRKAAMLEASQKAAEQMLQRYKDGLQDGARLSTGSVPRGLSSSRSTDLESPMTPHLSGIHVDRAVVESNSELMCSMEVRDLGDELYMHLCLYCASPYAPV